MKALVINVDNGPENHSRRTQFMQRLVEFVQQYQITVRLAYYPPYHQIQPDWTLLGHFRTTLEWVTARFGGGYRSICPHDDLERELSCGHISDNCLLDRSEVDQEGNGGG